MTALEIATTALATLSGMCQSKSGACPYGDDCYSAIAREALAAMRAAPVLARDGWGAELLRVERFQDEKVEPR